MPKETFVVSCPSAGIQSGVIYIDLAGLSLTEKDGQGKPVHEVKHRLLLTPEGAMDLHRATQSALDRLVEMGLLTRRDSQPREKDSDRENGAAAETKDPQSPNFS